MPGGHAIRSYPDRLDPAAVRPEFAVGVLLAEVVGSDGGRAADATVTILNEVSTKWPGGGGA